MKSIIFDFDAINDAINNKKSEKQEDTLESVQTNAGYWTPIEEIVPPNQCPLHPYHTFVEPDGGRFCRDPGCKWTWSPK